MIYKLLFVALLINKSL